MSLQFSTQAYDSGNHHYRVIVPKSEDEFLDEVAQEYKRLRTECAAPLTDLSLDGIEVMDLEALEARLLKATIPVRTGSPFDVLRSDFGEVAAALLLEKEYGTRFGYRGVRDRELTKLPGRGLDLIGVEQDEVLVLALGEVKVSAEKKSPPQVVEKSEDSLRMQHLGHLANRSETCSKILDASRRASDPSLRNLLMTAAVLFENGDVERLRVVAFCMMVRPVGVHKLDDFGTFRSTPSDYSPADVRFWILCTPQDIESTIDAWNARFRPDEEAT